MGAHANTHQYHTVINEATGRCSRCPRYTFPRPQYCALCVFIDCKQSAVLKAARRLARSVRLLATCNLPTCRSRLTPAWTYRTSLRGRTWYWSATPVGTRAVHRRRVQWCSVAEAKRAPRGRSVESLPRPARGRFPTEKLRTKTSSTSQRFAIFVWKFKIKFFFL